jgi:tRNA(Ile)-lysidine synthase
LKELEIKILRFIRKEGLLETGDRPLVAVSGGIDSITALYTIYDLCPLLKIPMPVVAHVNHKLRGAESERDQEFVKKIAQDLGLEFVTKSFNIRELAQDEKRSTQEIARKYRLKFLEDAAVRYGCDKIITGHNADDLAETVLMWITRGSGLKGASGILPRRGKFIRPLLCCSRREISFFAEKRGLIHVEDSSNMKMDYIRNIIRKEVLPLIETKCYSSARKNLVRFANLAKNDLDYLEKAAEEKTMQLAGPLGGNAEASIDVDMLIGLHPAIRSRVIRNLIRHVVGNLDNVSQLHVDKIMELCEQKEGGRRRLSIPGGYEAIRTYYKLLVRPVLKVDNSPSKKEGEFLVNYPGTTTIDELGIRIDIDLLPGGTAVGKYHFDDPYITFINADKVNLPLKVRLPKQGDTFIPLGSTGTKKLSDFFIDNKIPSDERWNIPVLTDEKEILWVIGRRINELYRINFTCKNVLMVKVSWM